MYSKTKHFRFGLLLSVFVLGTASMVSTLSMQRAGISTPAVAYADYGDGSCGGPIPPPWVDCPGTTPTATYTPTLTPTPTPTPISGR